MAIPSSSCCCCLRKKNPIPACTYVCLGYVCSGGVVVLHSKEYTHEMYNIFPKIFFSYAATCAGSSSFKLAAIATRLLQGLEEGWKNQASMWFGKNALECMVAFVYRMRVIHIHSSQSDNNSCSKHEKWDKRQHPKKDQISQLQFLSISKQETQTHCRIDPCNSTIQLKKASY